MLPFIFSAQKTEEIGTKSNKKKKQKNHLQIFTNFFLEEKLNLENNPKYPRVKTTGSCRCKFQKKNRDYFSFYKTNSLSQNLVLKYYLQRQ